MPKTDMTRLIRERLGKTAPEPEQPISPNGRGDGGQTGSQDDERRPSRGTMDDLIRRAFRRRQD
jgi:hypothetical protein